MALQGILCAAFRAAGSCLDIGAAFVLFRVMHGVQDNFRSANQAPGEGADRLSVGNGLVELNKGALATAERA